MQHQEQELFIDCDSMAGMSKEELYEFYSKIYQNIECYVQQIEISSRKQQYLKSYADSLLIEIQEAEKKLDELKNKENTNGELND
ncbi:uncharacterized protein KGF55_004900 [Candida pseudojiufengensis]|uniref:uncharacterized protein n=1 Tax=Candida pseudojiufengensis TaxID=497109 RepID=UPI0022252BEC|nr:uncharacterized protein KGF55_004900 [Candida pseudojiufengensis]KAI5960177.1 hypothetical protein KGF55_004900 [Candida pseudojiufengensis]